MINSPETLYEQERMFNKTGRSAPPHFRVCLSGGGNRSAAFGIGVLRALHEKSFIEKILAGTSTFDAGRPIQEGTTIFNDHHQNKIYYLKLSMHPGLLVDQAGVINAYAKKHPQFPQESTLDQYFQPAQFKAYRELGYAIAQTLSPDAAN